jgi:Flp pilus assembly protein TadD
MIKNCLVILLLLSACAGKDNASMRDISAAENSTLKPVYQALARGDYLEAQNILTELNAQKKPDAEALFLYAETLRLLQKQDEAIAAYQLVPHSSPFALDAIEGIALCKLFAGKLDQAADLLTKVVAADATRWRTINALGITQALQGMHEEALSYFALAQTLKPNALALRHNEALAYALHGEQAKAISLLKPLVTDEKLPNDMRRRIAFSLALVYGLAGDMNNAEQTLLPYLSAAEIANNLGTYAAMAKRPALARDYWSKAISASPVFYEKAWQNKESLKSKAN